MLNSEILWKQVTGPVRLIKKVSDSINNLKSVMLITPFGLPWASTFHYSVMDQVDEGMSFRFDFIDVENEFCEFLRENSKGNKGLVKSRYLPEDIVTRFLLRRYDKEYFYRPHIYKEQKKPEDFLLENNILNDTVL